MDALETPRPPSALSVPVSAPAVAGSSAAVGVGLGPPTRPGALGTLGDYEVLALVGEGGMGLVFRARARRDGHEVALKVLRPSLARIDRGRALFLKEAKHQQALSHPRVLPVLDRVECNEAVFLVLPHLARGSLATLLQAGPRLDRDRVVQIGCDVAEALAFAHARGIVHRDLKPTNVLIDDTGRALLADFGLARSVWNDELTDASRLAVEGTVPYLSPGCARGESEDTRGDTYAFGALLYEMLTGRPPYHGANRDEVIAQILAAPPPAITEQNPGAPAALVLIAEGAMARDLRQRYAHMQHVADDLARVAGGEPPLGPKGGGRFGAPLVLTARALKARLTGTLARRCWTLGVTLVAAAVIPLAAGWWWAHPPARLRLVQTVSLAGVDGWATTSRAVVPWHRSDLATIIAAPRDRVLFVSVNPEVNAQRVWRPPDRRAEVSMVLPDDIDGDGMSEAFVGWRAETNLFVSLVGFSGLERRRFEGLGAVRFGGKDANVPIPDSEFHPRAVADLDGDGNPELLVALSTGYAKRPRGLYCFDVAAGAPKWWFETAGCIQDVRAGDLDGNGLLEVVFGTDATDNGHTLEDGTCDAESYVIALEADGRPRWRVRTGGTYTHAHPVLADFDRDGWSDVMVAVWSSPEFWNEPRPPEGGVFRLGPDGALMARLEVTEARFWLGVGVGTEGPSPRLLVGDGDGMLRWVDGQLRVLASRRLEASLNPGAHGFAFVQPVGEIDLDGDGATEVIVLSHRIAWEGTPNPGFPDAPPTRARCSPTAVVVLDQDLRALDRVAVVGEREGAPAVNAGVANVRGDPRPEIVALADKAYVFSFERRR